jgi:DNA mismatch repair protein MutS2
MLLYPTHTLEKLEFDKIRALVAQYCRSESAKQMALALEPMTDVQEVRKHLLHVKDYRQINISGSHFPLDYVTDLSKELSLLAITDAVLEQESFTRIKRTALCIEGVFRFFTANEELYPHLESIVSGIYYEKNIVIMINGVFDENANVKDNASKDLLDIRNRLTKKRNELSRAFAQILQRFSKLGILTDSGQSIRNGRKVVSIVAESKRQVGGIIHDESDSGKTAFVEPAETVVLNNEIFELERAEEREVYRILRELTSNLAAYRQLIQSYQSVLVKFDLIQAKAKFANELNASYPILSDKPVINLRKAIHPLLYLHQKKVKKETILEDELSTYSSHLRAMRFFIDNADKKTIFLIDEFGTGSDPALGGAFAEAILEELAFKRSYGVVTTHYLNLKIMANKVKGIINGAMIFNEETLMPTYQLTVGKPGSSYTFAIAERTGLPRMLIERARDLVDNEHYQLDLLLNKVEQEHQLLLEKEKELTTKTTELNSLKKNYEELLSKVQQQRERQTQTVVSQGSKTTPFIREAEKRLQKLLQDWETRKDLEVVAAKTKELIKIASPKPAENKPSNISTQKNKLPEIKRTPAKLTPGSKVKVLSFDKNGQIQSIKGDKVTVVIDDMRVVVNKNDLAGI